LTQLDECPRGDDRVSSRERGAHRGIEHPRRHLARDRSARGDVHRGLRLATTPQHHHVPPVQRVPRVLDDRAAAESVW